jgi:hypothetical protein
MPRSAQSADALVDLCHRRQGTRWRPEEKGVKLQLNSTENGFWLDH